MKKTFRAFRNWTLALICLPLLWAVAKHTALLLPAVGAEGWKAWWLYAIGAAVYIVLDLFIAKPMWVYVFGHELTHAISGLATGAKIHSFKASSKGGEVQMSKSNAFVALAPYIFPIYGAIVVLLYALLRNWWLNPYLTGGFKFFLGFSVTFHLFLTFHAIHGRQPDLKVLGLFLSVVLIGLANLLILGLLGISLFGRTPTARQYAKAIGQETAVVWKKGFSLTRTKWMEIQRNSWTR
jgi:hypothetical protein